jgi:membrane-bound metal-dependent hydrolase YbcI (DUF457 family)
MGVGPMSSTIAHAASASWIAVTVAHVQPHETSYILAAWIAASILDLDHLIPLIRDRKAYQQQAREGNLHRARSVFHELFGLLVAGALSGLLLFVDRKLACVLFVAYAVHVAEDWMIGRSKPLSPIDNTEIQLFSPSLKQKIIIDIVLVVTFGVLWILYLTGRV